ncbi:MAG: tetratricopeptide repeat protein, partial [Acidobacteriota bacterium]|nr:tetratricopeptide repeat protein [Acidobacteriota bacterium]
TNLADVYLLTRDYKKAADVYRQVIALKPPYLFEYYQGLSHAYAMLNMDQEAMEALNAGIEADPNGGARYYRKLVEQDHAKWLEEFKKASENGEETLRGYDNLGVAYLNLKRYPEAIEVFEHLLLLDPKRAPAYNNLGKAYSEQNDEKRAIEYFARAIELAPNFPLPYNNLALSYLSLQRYPEALKTCQTVLVLRPDYAAAHYTIALVYLKLGDRDAAIREHRELLALNPHLANKLYESISKGSSVGTEARP